MGYFKKRGQITVFIIIGIIILMASASFFYFRDAATNLDPDIIPQGKTTALHPFVESCLEIKTMEALDRVGATGGYIYYPLGIENDPASYLKISPIDEVKMPYWWYSGEKRIPPLEFIEEQIELFVIDEIDECIDGFAAIKDYEVEKTGEIDADLTFADSDVIVKLKYPLKAIKIPQRNEFNLNGYDFFIKIPIRFKQVHDAAVAIMEDENTDYFMEYWTMDLISLADNPDKDYTTPLMNMEFSLRPRIWKPSAIKSNVKDLLTDNIQYVKFSNTQYQDIPEYFPYMQNHYVWNVRDDFNPQLHASLTFDEKWPFRIAVFPTKGGLLKSGQTRIGQYLSFIGIQTWHFTYDLVYPLIVTIKDDDSRRNDEYIFSYAFLVSVQKNRPFKENFGSTIFTAQDTVSEAEVCEYLMNSFDVEMSVRTYNAYTNQAKRGFDITYTCGRYTCEMGQTDWPTGSHGSVAELKTNFPYCPNGILRASKEGYEDKALFVGTENNKVVNLNMKPVKEFVNYTVVKHLYMPDNPEYSQVGEEEELFDDEEAVIIIKPEIGAEQYASYPSAEPLPIKMFKDKEFAYNVTIYLLNDNELLGGYEATWIVDPINVSNNDEIKFHVLEYQADTEEDQALFIVGMKSYSGLIPKPEFK